MKTANAKKSIPQNSYIRVRCVCRSPLVEVWNDRKLCAAAAFNIQHKIYTHSMRMTTNQKSRSANTSHAGNGPTHVCE